jgi:D-ribulokinase
MYVGLDFGTSGARVVAINQAQEIIFELKVGYDLTNVSTWCAALEQLLFSIPLEIRKETKRILIAATSSTVLICDRQGNPISDVLIYSDHRAIDLVPKIAKIAPPEHPVISATSSLAKLLWLLAQSDSTDSSERYFLHQADYLGFLLHGKLGIGDYHNCLKLGYDPVNLSYPDWLIELDLPINLPKVFCPGESVGRIRLEISDRFQLPRECEICAGTTDSTAAFIATVESLSLGVAVTSLGSTLVLKLVGDRQIICTEYGIYSHRLDWQGQTFWLVGGASNTGGAVIRHFFSDAEIATYSSQINPNIPSELNYYPLLKSGDRFPINDPKLLPVLQPRPGSEIDFLHGILTGIAKIETQGYELLEKLSGNRITQIYTNGGGAQNSTWTKIRQHYLGLEIKTACQTEAAYGAAKLALSMRREFPKKLGSQGAAP